MRAIIETPPITSPIAITIINSSNENPRCFFAMGVCSLRGTKDSLSRDTALPLFQYLAPHARNARRPDQITLVCGCRDRFLVSDFVRRGYCRLPVLRKVRRPDFRHSQR